MNIQFYIDQLNRSAATIRAMVGDLDDAQVRWRPADDKWSILEIVWHLADEEHEDFRTRLEMTLRKSVDAWPPIDPAGAVVSRAYNRRTLADAIATFSQERVTSVAWL